LARSSVTPSPVVRSFLRRFRLSTAALAALLAAPAAGCSHVAPYEREHLAKPGMDTKDREALRNRFYSHVYEAREGAMPAGDHAGGGCGCN
jgi:hypothetical protein